MKKLILKEEYKEVPFIEGIVKDIDYEYGYASIEIEGHNGYNLLPKCNCILSGNRVRLYRNDGKCVGFQVLDEKGEKSLMNAICVEEKKYLWSV